MPTYGVVICKKAEKQIKKLSKDEQKKVAEALVGLKKEQRPAGVEKLSQNPLFWRIRVGDHRVIYAINDDLKKVVVAVVRHRKDAYRDIEKLSPALIAKALQPFIQAGARP